MRQWYYADRQRQQQGPVDSAVLVDLFRNGEADSTTLVWHEGLSTWQPLSSVRDELGLLAAVQSVPPTGIASQPSGSVASTLTLAPLTPTPETPTTTATITPPQDPEAGRATLDFRMPASPRIQPRPATATPIPAPASTAESDQDDTYEPEINLVVLAGFWKRVAAYLIDAVLITLIALAALALLNRLGVSGMISSGLGTLLNPRLMWLGIAPMYTILFHASAAQATPGKLAIGIKVVTDEGQRLSLGESAARYLASLLNLITGHLAYLLAAFTERNQCLHDLICGTLVVDRWAYTAHPERQREELGLVATLVLFGTGLSILAMIVGSIMLAGALFSALGNWTR